MSSSGTRTALNARVTLDDGRYNAVEIARKPVDTSRKSQVVERRLLPDDNCHRLLDVKSFDVDTDDLSEAETEVAFGEFPRIGSSLPRRVNGLPSNLGHKPCNPRCRQVGRSSRKPVKVLGPVAELTANEAMQTYP